MQHKKNKSEKNFNSLNSGRIPKIPKLNATQKKEFALYFNSRSVFFLRFTIVVIISALIPYFILDYYSAPLTFKKIWVIRATVFFVPSIIVFFLSYKAFFVKHFQFIANTLNLLYNSAILLMLIILKHNELAFSNYYIGIIVIISIALAMRIRLIPTLINFAIVILAYIVILYFRQSQYNDFVLVSLNNLFFILSVVLAILITNYIIEIYTIRTFLQEKALQKQGNSLQIKNQEIRLQRDKTEKQKQQIEEVLKELSDSINYAQHIQESILPKYKALENCFSEHFVLFKPKDKVSGDFYWWTQKQEKVIVTVGDCTGHGVPGAFMSMLGISLLYGIINKEAIFHTGNILGGLRTEIIKILKQSTKIGSHSDGMDMSIIAYNLQNKILQFSGANNPIYIVKNGALNISNSVNNLINETSMPNISNKLYEIKPDRMPISIYRKTGNFTTHELQLEDGDQIYLFSDGYADQFGGEKGKKFKYKQLKELLLTISQKTLLEQEKILNKTFKSWKGDLEQLDDVCLVGLKI